MKNKIATLVIGSFLLFNCATDKAKEQREAKKYTIGYIGAAFRPTSDYSLGVSLNPGLLSSKSTTVTQGNSSKTYKASTRNYEIGGFGHAYIWPTSAFYLGLSVEQRKTTYNYQELTNAAPTTTDVHFSIERTIIGLPLGWDWIWENGITWFLDLGPRLVINKKVSYQNDGTNGNVDPDKRNTTVNSFSDSFSAIGGQSMIGFSF